MNKWVIIGQSGCSYCQDARLLLTEKGIEYAYFSTTEAPILKKLLRDMGLTKVPQVFHNGMRIGGYNELRVYLDADHI